MCVCVTDSFVVFVYQSRRVLPNRRSFLHEDPPRRKTTHRVLRTLHLRTRRPRLANQGGLRVWAWGMPANTQTLESFNLGLPLRVVRLPVGTCDTEQGGGRVSTALGVVDEKSQRVWIGHAIASTPVEGFKHLQSMALPTIPDAYGKWMHTSIGGVSRTVRRVGILRCRPKHQGGAVVLFAVRAPTATTVADALRHDEHDGDVVVGDAQWVEEFGHVTEVVVYDPALVARVAACVARAGAEPRFEDATLDAQRGLGIERLDRIRSRVSRYEGEVDDDDPDDLDSYGLRRGTENWRFPWMPPHWHFAPITWDYMVANVQHEDLESLPQPLRQHVARAKLESNTLPPMGTLWTETFPPTEAERRNGSGVHGGRRDRHPLMRTIVGSPWLSTQLGQGRTSFSTNEVAEQMSPVVTATSHGPERPDDDDGWVWSPRDMVESSDGRWFRPRDLRQVYQKHVPKKRYVSAALTEAQSKQLVHAFYGLVLEGTHDEETREALSLVLFHYMKERGYTARWMGKYVQNALNVGNGDEFRNFERLAQYAPAKLPTAVLNKLCGRDGRLHCRGSKGTRSKYAVHKPRYKPKSRLLRTRHQDIVHAS